MAHSNHRNNNGRGVRRPVERISESPTTVRPTLIVGLGGTGVLIAQWAHHLIRELFGTIPPFIRFLGLDTDAQEENGPKDPLPASDFINLFDGFHLGEVLRDRYQFRQMHRHLRWLGEMKLDAAIADRGAQGISRLGRVVFFETWQQIHRAVVARYDALNSNNLYNDTQNMAPQNQFDLGNTPVIHVAASVCGGTGSGLLIDLAYALREWANERFHHQSEVVGHLVLPEAFGIVSPRILDKLRAVTATTLEQIELLMDSRRRDVEVVYPNGVVRRFTQTRAPFDACFLVNGYGPGGGDDRLHLVEMVGRVIRAMTVEPASKTIASDLNNKKQDILGNVEDQIRRRLCFASYGLRYGTAGIPEEKVEDRTNRVRRWLYDSLSKAASDDAEERLDADIEEVFRRDLSLTELTKRLRSAVPAAFAWPTAIAAGATPNQTVLAAVHSYIQQRVGQLQTELGKVHEEIRRQDAPGRSGPPPRSLRHAFLHRAMSAEVLLPPNRPGADPGGEIPRLRRGHAFARQSAHFLKRQADLFRPDDPTAAQNTALRQVNDALTALAQQTGVQNFLQITPAQGTAVAQRALNVADEALARAVAGNTYARLLQANRSDCETRARAFQVLAETAEFELKGLPSDEDMRLISRSPYATSLFELTHPDAGSQEENGSIRRRFHQTLVMPVGKAFVDAAPPQEEHSAAVKRLTDIMDGSSDRLEEFLIQYQENMSREFHSRAVDVRDPSAHPFFTKVNDITHRALPKIATDKRNRYSQPLDVVVSQHNPQSCVKALLETLGRDIRTASVCHEFEKYTNIWFQLMNFRYGFCLPALDNYEEYVEARKRYCERAGFEIEDLMLDPEWRRDCEFLYQTCARETARMQGLGGAAPDTGAAGALQGLMGFRAAVKDFFARVNEKCMKHDFYPQKKQNECRFQIVTTEQSLDLAVDTAAARNGADVPPELLRFAHREFDLLQGGLRATEGTFAAAVLPDFQAIHGVLKCCASATVAEAAPPANPPASEVR